ncbi:uncharacterized protein LOC119591089 [Penaeus monodon]|uniref:uncharacterized protein LOC119591089 n=1 Tax=Penaeus monodon TaxID=6687 RepID=UPI0018A7C238|nr:uncharacterized protein LOC119591089 [Penaeus monodon]
MFLSLRIVYFSTLRSCPSWSPSPLLAEVDLAVDMEVDLAVDTEVDLEDPEVTAAEDSVAVALAEDTEEDLAVADSEGLEATAAEDSEEVDLPVDTEVDSAEDAAVDLEDPEVMAAEDSEEVALEEAMEASGEASVAVVEAALEESLKRRNLPSIYSREKNDRRRCLRVLVRYILMIIDLNVKRIKEVVPHKPPPPNLCRHGLRNLLV